MQQHGFEPVTPVDHRAWLWVRLPPQHQQDCFTDSFPSQVVSLLSLTYSALCLGARLIGKWDLLWYDDAVMGVAYVSEDGICNAETVVTCTGLRHCALQHYIQCDFVRFRSLAEYSVVARDNISFRGNYKLRGSLLCNKQIN